MSVAQPYPASLGTSPVLSVLWPSGPPPEQTSTQSVYRWATVVTGDPLTIRMDGDSQPLPMVPENLTTGPLPIGARVWTQMFGRRVLVIGTSSRAVTARISAEAFMRNAIRMISGGGIRTHTSVGVRWSARLLLLAVGVAALDAPSGYFSVEMPPDGTLIERRTAGAVTTTTVAGGIVPLTAHEVLWYDLPMGQVSTSQPGRFHITHTTMGAFDIPSTWVPVVLRNTDATGHQYQWADGLLSGPWNALTLSNGWGNYGGGFTSASYAKQSGFVRVRGVISGGTTTAGILLGNLPVGYRPVGAMIFPGVTNAATARLDVQANGNIIASGASASWLSLDAISFIPEG